ncbi:MAG: serine--tRNA ligase [Dehalococcoidia bacterium]
MIDINLLRNQKDLVAQMMKNRSEDVDLDNILELDVTRRNLIQIVDELRSKRNTVSKEIAQMKEKPPELIEEMRKVGDNIKETEEKIRKNEQELHLKLLEIPNILENDILIGHDESENKVIHTWGSPIEYNFSPKPHWEINDTLNIIDFEAGVKVSGSRFFILRGQGAKLERALINWMLDKHTIENKFEEIQVPALVKQETMTGSGNLPKFEENLYRDTDDDLWLIPTAEVPLTSIHHDDILNGDELPKNYVAYSPSFRKEKTSAGRDTRGIKRVHQFNKVELYKIVSPETSKSELHNLINIVENLLQELGLHYRLLELCSSDIGFQSAQSFDLEVWAPGSEEWLEVSSCSNCLDFQSRRANIKFKREQSSRTEYPHTLNGSALALPRIMISILETYQQIDGTVVIPKVLHKYTGFTEIKPQNL